MVQVSTIADELDAPKILIRGSEPSDLPLVADQWRSSWRAGGKQRRLTRIAYDAVFDRAVTRGAMAQPECRIVVASDSLETDVVIGWACYVPGALPILHYAYVRAPMRRRGLFGVLLAAASVVSRVVYTFHPPDRSHRLGRRQVDPEPSLLAAARARGIVAEYHPITEYLRGR